MFKNLLKYAWRNLGFRTAYLDHNFRVLLKEWRNNRDGPQWPCSIDKPVVLLIPPDPALLLASKGDEAMITAVITHIQKKWPDVQFLAATASETADASAQGIGIEPVRVLDPKLNLKQSMAMLEGRNICASVTVGADVLDGSYSHVFSARLLMLTDMLARRGVDCVVTGFSFSKTPYEALSEVLDGFADDVVFNLRDPMSFARFKKFTRAPARLVADVAFLLQPQHGSAPLAEVEGWIKQQHQDGRTVLGLNLHPLLLEMDQRQNIGQVVQNFAAVIRQLINHNAVSVVMVEHDFRGDSADYHCMNLLAEDLRSDLAHFVFKPETRLNAAELKGVVEYMDGIVSGRMHLMIASCGAGTPVFGIEYKDKMEGLMKHFGLNTGNLSTAREVLNHPEVLQQKLEHFIGNLSSDREQMASRMLEVKRLSSMNFSSFTAHSKRCERPNTVIPQPLT